MRKQTFLLLTLLGIAILFVACDGNTNREWKIRNNSSLFIRVTATTIFDGDPTVETIIPGFTKVFAITDQLGGTSTPQLPNQVFSSMLIINETGDTVNKDYTNPGNWETSIKQTKKLPSLFKQKYVLVVTENDF